MTYRRVCSHPTFNSTGRVGCDLISTSYLILLECRGGVHWLIHWGVEVCSNIKGFRFFLHQILQACGELYTPDVGCTFCGHYVCDVKNILFLSNGKWKLVLQAEKKRSYILINVSEREFTKLTTGMKHLKLLSSSFSIKLLSHIWLWNRSQAQREIWVRDWWVWWSLIQNLPSS